MKSSRKVYGALILLLGLVVALVGCVQSETTEYDVISDPEAELNLDLPENPKVVALGWSDGDIALSLGVKPIAIYDWQGFGEEGKGVGEWVVDEFGEDSPEILSAGAEGAFNYQQIKELEPDLILNVRAAEDEAVTNSLKEIAPVVVAPAGSGDFAVNWKVQTELIGNALGKGDEASALVTETEEAQAAIREANPDFEGKTFVYGAKFGEAYGAYLAGDARFDIFAELGFVANPPVTELEAAGFFASVPVERVASMDAQVAVFTGIGFTLEQLETDPLLTSLPVTQAGRAIVLAEDDPINVALGAGTPVSLKFALEAIAPRLAEAVGRI